MELSLYALDCVCHNAEPGAYGHECGKPARWLGTSHSGMVSGFCEGCKVNSYEAKGKTAWRCIGRPWRVEQWRDGGVFRGWQVVRDLDEGRKAYVATFEAPTGPIDGWRHRIAAQTLCTDLNRKELAL